jgi:hypothetical protein
LLCFALLFFAACQKSSSKLKALVKEKEEGTLLFGLDLLRTNSRVERKNLVELSTN